MTSIRYKLVSGNVCMIVFEVFLCRGEHKFNAVQLVYLGSAGVIVDGNNVGKWVLMAYLLDDAFAHHMVRQTAKGLCAYNVRSAGMD